MTAQDQPGSRAVLGPGAYAVAASFFLALALYGSFVPFTYRALSWDEALIGWRKVHWHSMSLEGRSDFVANILLFIPLGYLFMGALCVDRHAAVGFPATLLVVPLLCGVAVAIEFTQLWFPPRTVSLNDIGAESSGAAVGVVGWLCLGRRITVWARATWTALGRREWAARVLPGYLAFLVLVHVMPLDLTISPVEIWHKYKEGRIILRPFGNANAVGLAVVATKQLWNVAYFAPVGFLLANVRGWRTASPARILFAGFLLAGGMEFLQLFVWTRYTDVTDVGIGALAVWVGWLGARQLTARRSDESKARFSPYLRAALLAAWFGVLIAVNWAPFDFSPDHRDWLQRLEAMPISPFVDLYYGTEYHAFDQVLSKTLLFLPIGALLASPRRSTFWALPVGFLLSVGLEIGQLGLPTRYASTTDVLIETTAVWVGCFLARRVVALSTAPRDRKPNPSALHAIGTR